MKVKKVNTFNLFKPHSVIVSCQALPDEPLHGSHFMSKMALAAQLGGARGIRANGQEDIKAILACVNLPIIGIVKRHYLDSPIYITPTIKEVQEVVEAGAQIVAIDATNRPRPQGETLESMMKKIKVMYPHMTLMADIATISEGIQAAALGFDIISTTMAGYTEETKGVALPNYRLVKNLLKHTQCPIIAEGGIQSPAELLKLFRLGVYGAVIGSAITRPQIITENFVKVIDYV